MSSSDSSPNPNPAPHKTIEGLKATKEEGPPQPELVGFVQTFYLDVHDSTVMFNFYLTS